MKELDDRIKADKKEKERIRAEKAAKREAERAAKWKAKIGTNVNVVVVVSRRCVARVPPR